MEAVPNTHSGLVHEAQACSPQLPPPRFHHAPPPPQPPPLMSLPSLVPLDATFPHQPRHHRQQHRQHYHQPASRAWSRARKSSPWSLREDQLLASLAAAQTQQGLSTMTNVWTKIADQLPGRNGKQCRERWLNQLQPGIRKDSWDADEDAVLTQAHAIFGNRWVAIAKMLPGRTDNCVKNRWNSRKRRAIRLQATKKHKPSPFKRSPVMDIQNLTCPTDEDVYLPSCSSIVSGQDSSESNSALSTLAELAGHPDLPSSSTLQHTYPEHSTTFQCN